MSHSRQGKHSVSDYTIDFWTMAASSGISGAQFHVFSNGLVEEIKGEIITHDNQNVSGWNGLITTSLTPYNRTP